MNPTQPIILPCRDQSPEIHPTCWLAPNATIIGHVTMGEDSSCWFNCVIRGDVAPITIGNKVNIQDGAVIHGTYGKSQTVLEDGASIGHNATVHGAHVKSGALIGMNAVVLDGAVVGEHAVVAAGAVVLLRPQPSRLKRPQQRAPTETPKIYACMWLAALSCLCGTRGRGCCAARWVRRTHLWTPVGRGGY